MKKLMFTLIAVANMTTGCFAQMHYNFPESYSDDLRNAIRFGAKIKMTLRVFDAQDAPVTNAHVQTSFKDARFDSIDASGFTDTNGLFVPEGKSSINTMGGTISKKGYYKSYFGNSFLYNQDDKSDWVKGGRWQPWNPTIPIVLRDIRNPIPMYVKEFRGYFNNKETVGFDCLKGDFVKPHGIGETADFMIQSEVGGVPYKLTTQSISLDSFDPDAGFMVLKKYNQSDFKSEYFAPEFGYSTNLIAASSYGGSKGFQGTRPYDPGSEYLVFKSRIVRDEDGRVTSANYGKIYGDFFYGRADDEMKKISVVFTYYLNPTPNDRNLEFDGKNNSFYPNSKTSRFIP